MTKDVRLDDLAEDELSDAVAWYERARQGLGAELWDVVWGVLNRIQDAPELGTLVSGVDSELGVRRMLVWRFPFTVVYCELEREIRVLAIAHAKRRPLYWKKRLGARPGTVEK